MILHLDVEEPIDPAGDFCRVQFSESPSNSVQNDTY